MNVLEIEISPKKSDSCAMAHFAVDGTEYMVLAGGHSVSVVAGKLWINSRRSMGKCFHNIGEIETHYKKHGKIIREYADRLMAAN